MKPETLSKVVDKLESYIEYASHLPIECMNVEMVVKSVLARDALLKEIKCLEP
jgi:hypothetical protein